ncbi:MAG: DNA-protecting protein DprA [Clostridium sp.]|nr:DNA-protecting protein DprA [Clostridium sp.]
MISLSKDSYALLLLCSDLAMPVSADYKHFTLKEWQTFSCKLKNSPLSRPESLFSSTPDDWRVHLGLTEEQVGRMKKLLARSGQLGIELERLNNMGIWVTTRAEATYPQRLKRVLMQKSPVVLYGAGDRQLLGYEGVAVVGSRNVDKNGAFFTEQLAKKCADEKLTVVSGGAAGVDSIAQDAALKAGGTVISVLADGLEPKIMRREYREAIMANQLLLLSCYNPKAHFKVYTAMERNKYIYALANYGVVVSSSIDKGGTWAGATENLRAGWVPLFVRAGDDMPEGNKKLLEQGGIPIDEAVLNQQGLKKWFGEQVTVVNDRLGRVGLLKEDDSVTYVCDTSTYIGVWPSLETALDVPRNYKELAEMFSVPESRVKDWLKKALDEGKVKKLTRPVRFLAVTTEQQSIFDLGVNE